MTRDEFEAWVNNALPGMKAVYFTAVADRQGLTEPIRRVAPDVANVAWSLAVIGAVTLVQRRLPNRSIEYIAIRVSREFGLRNAPTRMMAA